MEAVIKNYTSIRNGATSDRGVVSDPEDLKVIL